MPGRVDDHGAMLRVRSPIRRGRRLLSGVVLLLLALGAILAARGYHLRPPAREPGRLVLVPEDIRVPTLWDVARQAEMTTASIQWPVSVGARVTWNIP